MDKKPSFTCSFTDDEKRQILNMSGLTKDEEIRAFFNELREQGLTFGEYLAQGAEIDSLYPDGLYHGNVEKAIFNLTNMVGKLVAENQKLSKQIAVERETSGFMIGLLAESNDLKFPKLQEYIDSLDIETIRIYQKAYPNLFGPYGKFEKHIANRMNKVKVNSNEEKEDEETSR